MTESSDGERAADEGSDASEDDAERPIVGPRFVVGTTSIDDLDAFLRTVRSIRETTGTVVQVFDARYVVSTTHLERAVARAERAVERGEEVARDRAVETLLYAAGRRQIDDALEMGVDEGETPAIAVVYAPANNDANRIGKTANDGRDGDIEAAIDRVRALFVDATVCKPGGSVDRLAERTDTDRVRSFYDVTDRELAATDGTLTDVIEERVALLDVEK
ncbi:KEOPS complex subunit Cgi121 [Halopenitus sp. H-Gu1]|uniref:KEOPS complex subunit Cgi121 n=1 Tax=Halopenitus sp. H-Gu1 TaxID=3242697 RepID=UPI00359CC118